MVGAGVAKERRRATVLERDEAQPVPLSRPSRDSHGVSYRQGLLFCCSWEITFQEKYY